MSTLATSSRKLDLIEETRNILRGKAQSSKELKELYLKLEELDQFAYATDVLLAKMKQDEKEGNPISLKERHALVKFIYKDHSLPSSFKFNKALKKLNSYDELSSTDKCETLGLAGAIHKYKWLYDHQYKNLERSLFYYQRGHESWKKYLTLDPATKAAHPHLNDDGYTAINYAYILELMAIDKLENLRNVADVSDYVMTQLTTAHEARYFILEQFIKDPSAEEPQFKESAYPVWVIAIVAEAFFGLRNYKSALKFIQEYKKREKESAIKNDPSLTDDEKIVAWKIRTFGRQLFSIAYLQNIQWQSSKTDLKNFTKNFAEGIDLEAMTACLGALATDKGRAPSYAEIKKEGKTGLALSGGGFRASLFHIGVLAALAERDRLKDIEVISCVSGGSILGAFYYLKLKKQLEENEDGKVDYLLVVKNVEKEFLTGIQHNLRMRVISNLWCNLKMVFLKNYSRTHRLGELYEKYLYHSLLEKEKGVPIYMNDLFINPKGEGDFSISSDNWKRKNKVPQLILNATSVNTGHNWQFTASWMGEPPGSIQSDIDVKPRLRRMYYKDAPKPYRQFRLGYGVGASSCVPVMFEPLPMFDLYPESNDVTAKERIELQLVDGGLHDNQGIASLIEQECKNMIISDASGQMPTTIEAAKNELSVFYRADSILQERLRELQFKDLKERAYTTQINSLVTMHLKNGLQQMPLSWMYCTDPPRTVYEEDWNNDPNELTDFGVLRSVQRLLSEVRTDLDSFNEIEANALMYSGYKQTHEEFRLRDGVQMDDNPQWKFMSIKEYVTVPEKALEIEKVLTTARKVPLKLIDLVPSLKIAAIGGVVIFSVVILYFGFRYWSEPLFTLPVSTAVYAFIVILIGLLSKVIAAVLGFKTMIRKKIILSIVMSCLWIASNIYLIGFNGLYNRKGRLETKKDKG